MYNNDFLFHNARPRLDIYLKNDLSDSMNADNKTPIDQLNRSIRHVIETLKQMVADGTLNADVYLHIYGYNIDIVFEKHCRLEEYEHEDMTASSGTNYAPALQAVRANLEEVYCSNKNTFDVTPCMPVIIDITDGAPQPQYRDQLKEALAQWNSGKAAMVAKRAIKCAILVVNNMDISELTQVVGDREAVIRADDLESLESILKAVTMTSSVLARGNAATGADVIAQVREDMHDYQPSAADAFGAEEEIINL